MDFPLAEAVGVTAGTLTTASFAPQVVRTFRSRSVRDISLRMYLLMSTGIALWVVYGVMIASFSVIVANAVSLMLTVSILVMKVVFSRQAARSGQCPCCGVDKSN
ncbi:Sugar transporter SemiSWEET [Fundidesulfovibrio magnetotacticus]|uniref:Sugar transporter SemiSWEET n=1 Tax=Fundidesulfovibrio magnetotacticus TaxID=2730080 RepID=A0A6V8LYQ6_9BACT|nr:SemiSWEET transporter [Fundidesulfovibrio magnetotacticus]GFK95368.1 Sugar transporter SemiSWEET [Fundidesulfovibrio magnetotacticus]